MTPTPPEPTKITCRNCNKQNVPNWKDGLCITCARDEVLGKPEPSTDPQDKQREEINQILVQFSKDLAIIQGEYNAGEKLSSVQKNAEDAQRKAHKAIDLYTQSRERDARLDECEKMIAYERSIGTSHYYYVNVQHIKDRIAELKQGDTDGNV